MSETVRRFATRCRNTATCTEPAGWKCRRGRGKGVAMQACSLERAAHWKRAGEWGDLRLNQSDTQHIAGIAAIAVMCGPPPAPLRNHLW